MMGSIRDGYEAASTRRYLEQDRANKERERGKLISDLLVALAERPGARRALRYLLSEEES